jgi:Pentapeptide repeats (8 copies)
MRQVSAFLRRHLLTTPRNYLVLAVLVTLWIFLELIAQWSHSAQSFDAVAFLGKHLLAVAIVGGCLLILALIWLPKWQATRPDLTTKERFEVENNARKTLAEIVGGAALLAGLYFTWSGLEVSREGQITDRFTKAIVQLGEQGREKLAVRLGGIYALERIAKDSKEDHWPIMEVLTAYVRETAPWLPKPPKDAQPLKGDQSPREEPPTTQEQRPPRPATDIQAILTVLGRRTRTYENGEQQRLNLAQTDLRGAYLPGAQLQGADLRGAQLRGAHLAHAQLEGARDLTVEQLSIVNTLYRAQLDPPLQEQIQQQYPQLLEP